MKKVLFVLLVFLCYWYCSISSAIFYAEEIMYENTPSINDFETFIKDLDVYKEYSNNINEEIIKQISSDGKITRYVIAYSLNNEEYENYTRTMFFIGDDFGKLMDVSIVDISENTVIITDLLKNVINRINNSKGPVVWCSRQTCTQYGTIVGVNPSSGCSTFIGQICNNMNIYNRKINWAICRLAVWIGCNTYLQTGVCVKYDTDFYDCSL